MISFVRKNYVAIGLVSEEIFPKTLFFSQDGQLKKFFYQNIKKCNLVV